MAVVDQVNCEVLDTLMGIPQRNREKYAPTVSLFW
jgi:hypothetical protein